MAILKAARLGHPIIRTRARVLTRAEITSSEVQRLIEDMIETMREYDGVGLAAPQIHVPKQIAVIEVNHNPRYPKMPAVPLVVLINPTIVKRSKKLVEDWEGCLSIPDLRGMVPRSESVECEALDRGGKTIKIAADGFFARVIQHECDHLQGMVYLDRMSKLRSLTHLAEFTRYGIGDQTRYD
ncbi:MAG: peptide deformylase [Omnitrophica bacterium RIFCSPLOWO2_01_FULL_50_24]|nr:MAG: peptide deformylase [Omnitrophica bacterium RIFCSPLOWO2_01_FULL_50_24]